jgi:hypothetical protein
VHIAHPLRIVKTPNASYNGMHMVTPELLDFIRAGQVSGMTRESIFQMLLNEGGWSKEDVEEAFLTILPVEKAPELSPPIEPTPPTVKEEVSPPDLIKPAPGETLEDASASAPPPVLVPAIHVAEKEVLPTSEVAPTPVETIVSQEPKSVFDEKKVNLKMTHSLPPPAVVPLGEDFLGIFGPPSDDFIAEVVHQGELPQAPISILSQRETHPPAVHFERLKDVEGDATKTTLPSGETLASTSSAEKTPVIKFSFEKLRSSVATPAPVATAIDSKKDVESPIPLNTSPDTKKSLGEYLAPPEISASLYPQRSPETVARSAPPQKRTMASDMLLVGQIENREVKQEPSTQVSPVVTHIKVDEPGTFEKNDISEKKNEEIPVSFTQISLPSPVAAKEKNATEDGQKEQKHPKRLIVFSVVGIIAILLLSALGYWGWNLVAPNTVQMALSAQENFFSLNSFGYKAAVTTDMHLTPRSGGGGGESDIRINLASAGSLFLNQAGYGDGTHRLVLKGGFQSGATAWPTDVEVDVRIIGSALYFHLLTLPDASNLDPALFRKYWIKVDLAEIAKELSLSGVIASQEGYGDFGGKDWNQTFNKLLEKTAPLNNFSNLPTEQIDGVSVGHMQFGVDSDKALQFISQLYRKYIGKELLLNDEEQELFKDALQKVVGEIWVDKGQGRLVRIALHAALDDDISSIHVSGSVDIDIALSDFNVPPVIENPTPMLTLEELRVQMDSYKIVREIRMRDDEKVKNLQRITLALGAFKDTKGKYPVALRELYSSGMLASSTLSDATLRLYKYVAYLSSSPISRATLCSVKMGNCGFYHIGVSLEEVGGALLVDDADLRSELDGADDMGCNGEFQRTCYDIVSNSVVSSGSATTTPILPASTSTKSSAK